MAVRDSFSKNLGLLTRASRYFTKTWGILTNNCDAVNKIRTKRITLTKNACGRARFSLKTVEFERKIQELEITTTPRNTLQGNSQITAEARPLRDRDQI
jgi:hypothetical protein